MTLFQKIADLVPLGYIISFKPEITNLSISVEYYKGEQYYSQESWLPLQDHFYEAKVVDCIDFMVKKINTEIDG